MTERDILERIRAWRQQPLADDGQHNWDWITSMMDEAGREIERLRLLTEEIKRNVGEEISDISYKPFKR